MLVPSRVNADAREAFVERNAKQSGDFAEKTTSVDLYVIETIKYYLILKRLFDIVVTLVILPFVVIVVFACAALIRRDGGPAFYSQPRVGRGGQIYRLWKLRSMVPDAEQVLEDHLSRFPEARSEWDRMQKLAYDPRITRLGRFLRKYSIDELPQLLNVLAGDMSLVGPRPMLPEQRQHYPGTAYFELRPGLTGLWQISERNKCTFVERAMYDTRYSAIISFPVDLWIILRTPLIVLKGTGV